jgi:glycerol dehydrogenase-like iron-containing ADH family enzyme
VPAAEHIEVEYGDDVLPDAIASLGAYTAVVDPHAWRLCASRLGEPARVLEPTSLEQDELDRWAARAAADAAVVGIGGGLALDAAKYVADARGGDGEVILVPSLTSSNAPFSDTIAVRRSGEPAGAVRHGQPKRVIVDYRLIGAADAELNRAGYADVLAHETAVADAAAADPDPGAVARRTREELLALTRGARSAAAEIAVMDSAAISTLMRLFHRAAGPVSAAPGLGSGTEHLIAWTLEATTGRHFRHGEIVGLGIVIAAHLQGGDVVGLDEALSRAQVPHRPVDLNIDWADLKRALIAVPEYNRRVRRIATVIDDRTWTPARLAEVKAVLAP